MGSAVAPGGNPANGLAGLDAATRLDTAARIHVPQDPDISAGIALDLDRPAEHLAAPTLAPHHVG